jgi:hypothetical protein
MNSVKKVVDMDTQAQTYKNTADINALAVTVTRITTLMEANEKLRMNDLEVIRKMADGIDTLNQRIGAVVGLDKDISVIKEQARENKENIRVLSHDMNTANNVLGILPSINERLTKAEARQEASEKWQDKVDGATTAIKYAVYVFWAVFGTAILAGLYYFMDMYFTSHHKVTTSYKTESTDGE